MPALSQGFFKLNELRLKGLNLENIKNILGLLYVILIIQKGAKDDFKIKEGKRESFRL